MESTATHQASADTHWQINQHTHTYEGYLETCTCEPKYIVNKDDWLFFPKVISYDISSELMITTSLKVSRFLLVSHWFLSPAPYPTHGADREGDSQKV